MRPTRYKIFDQLDMEKRALIKECLTEASYVTGENIITHGDKSDTYYIIKKGSVVVLKKMLSDDLEQVEVLGDGEGFGEDAILNGTKQQVTVRALETTIVWKISRCLFESVFKASYLEHVFPEEIEEQVHGTYTLLDVRMREEFEEERIPGAINIPVDDVRLRLNELNHEEQYYVYCLAGSRSATASFILKSKGYKVRNVQGGILAWSGPLTNDEKIINNEQCVPT